MIEKIINLIRRARLPLSKEKDLQFEMYKMFCEQGYLISREYRLDEKSIVDFFEPKFGIAIEVKIKGKAKDIFRQLERYAQSHEVHSIILVTRKAMGLPQEIRGKSIYYVSLGTGWL